MTHICNSKLTIIGSDNGVSPGWRQTIIWTNAEILLTEPLGTKFGEILIEIHTCSFIKMHLKIPSAKWGQFCLGLNVLIKVRAVITYQCPERKQLFPFSAIDVWTWMDDYRQTFNISRTISPNLNVSRTALELFLPNPIKAGVKSKIKM